MAVTYNYGAAPTYVKIASQTLTGSASTVTFSNIPQGYTDLVLVVKAISTGTSQPDVYMQVNGSSTTYSRTRMGGNGSSTFTNNITSETFWVLGPMENVASTDMVCNLMNYSSASVFKTMLVRSDDSVIATQAMISLWRNTTPITSILLYPEPAKGDFATGSTFTIYGIKAAFVPKATGGDIIVQDGTYWYHAFLSSSTFIPKSTLSCDVLAVAGAGGGGGTSAGSSPAGGGGAGGIFYTTTQSFSTAQIVTVGAGGATSTSASNVNGNAGSNTTFGSLTAALGGGYGAGSTTGGSGGSGGGGRNGGAGGSSTQTGTGGTGYGFAGGAGNQFAGGGGGGSSAVGSAGQNVGSGSNGGAGGAGLNTWSSWLLTTRLGVSGYIAGGGGGGSYGATGGSGGSGGGGAGTITNGVNGIANTGSGGGGSGGGAGAGGAGGSGLVIVRYPI